MAETPRIRLWPVVVFGVITCAAVALLACLPALDLDGRQCPCTEGYQCNLVTNTCVSGGTKVAADAGTTEAGDADCDPMIGTLYSSDFTKGVSDWTVEHGTWATDGGVLFQMDPSTSEVANLWVTALTGASDYHAATRMRRLSDAGTGALELGFRINPALPHRYTCTWVPAPVAESDGGLSGTFGMLDSDDNKNVSNYLETLTVPLPSSYDADMWITLHARTVGQDADCWIDEIPGAVLHIGGAIGHPTGSFGPRTYVTKAEFDYVRACAIRR